MERILEMTATADLRDRAPHTLSGGQKQRVALAATLALGTEVLILDEPTSELDEEGTQMLFRIIERLKAEGTTVLIVEHKLDALFALADRMVFLERGRILAEGAPEELLRDERVRAVLHAEPPATSFPRGRGSPRSRRRSHRSFGWTGSSTPTTALQPSGASTSRSGPGSSWP